MNAVVSIAKFDNKIYYSKKKNMLSKLECLWQQHTCFTCLSMLEEPSWTTCTILHFSQMILVNKDAHNHCLINKLFGSKIWADCRHGACRLRAHLWHWSQSVHNLIVTNVCNVVSLWKKIANNPTSNFVVKITITSKF